MENFNEINGNRITLWNTRFAMRPNLAGDPTKSYSKFNPRERVCWLVIDEPMALELEARGARVNKYVREDRDTGEEIVTYSVQPKVDYQEGKIPPKIFLVNSDGDRGPAMEPRDLVAIDRLVEDSFANIANIQAVINMWTNPDTGKTNLYLQVMYVFQRAAYNDPFAGQFIVD